MPAEIQSESDDELCQTLRAEEFEVLESIYPEYISSKTLDGFVKFEIPVELTNSNSIVISEPISSDPVPSFPERRPTVLSISASALPPLLLHIALPPSYPLHSPPQIISVRATHAWVPDIGRLRKALFDLWQAGDPCLYNWVEFIRTGEFLQKVGLSMSPDVITLPHPAPQIIAPLLTTYENFLRCNQFAQNVYTCSICLVSHKGSKCLQLLCNHIFCRSCLEDFWKLCINEGDIGRVGCPDPGCVKKLSEASEEEVARVVNDAELQRWRWLREKRDTDRDPTIIHCPVSVCQAPVSKPKDVDTESGWSRLRQCPLCAFTFCAFCKRTWHGPLSNCPISQYEDLAQAYLAAAEGSEKREILERRYGKANIRRLIAAYEEEKANLEWLKSSATMCPGCQCYVEKSRGCNHMTCWKCMQHFCYRCGQKLNADQPYAHFSQPGRPCFNQLFDVIEVDEQDWEVEW
ncbi:RWD-domain-containing protein [Pholiota conissans]|uniref:RBR-type E3 ubiquitin transferase n=1 Tax=Pholiota conissans TaxID=109636 RepID=A0A9P6CUE4_9AGAR|nr:RWD-domain-containing protein [Pholiota conissans]